MEETEQIEKIRSFIDKIIVEELGKLQQAGLSYMQFVLMGQAIEVLGGFLDSKPMKAKGQSAKRFAKGVNALLGGRYRLLNDRCFLYDKLRNQMTHSFIPGGDLVLFRNRGEAGTYRHLEYTDGRLVLIGDVFYEDLCAAAHRLMDDLEKGRIKPKNIAFDYER